MLAAEVNRNQEVALKISVYIQEQMYFFVSSVSIDALIEKKLKQFRNTAVLEEIC